MQQLFDGQDADGNSSTRKHKGGPLTIVGEGTWGGGTITLQISPDGGTTWVSTSTTLTADGVAILDDLCAAAIRLALSGATNPDLNAWIG